MCVLRKWSQFMFYVDIDVSPNAYECINDELKPIYDNLC